jgi:hypothetical protein
MNSRLEGPAEKTRNEETDETARQFRLYIVAICSPLLDVKIIGGWDFLEQSKF